MLKKIFYFIVIINSFLVLLSVIYFLFFFEKNKIVYVDDIRVFNEFKMTKELQKKGDIELRYQKERIDSLYSVLNTLMDEQKKRELVQEIIKQKQSLEEFQTVYINDNSNKIRKRINGYIVDFSKQEGFDFVLASQNNENVLYGDSKKDVTNLVLTYINKRYEGFN